MAGDYVDEIGTRLMTSLCEAASIAAVVVI